MNAIITTLGIMHSAPALQGWNGDGSVEKAGEEEEWPCTLSNLQ